MIKIVLNFKSQGTEKLELFSQWNNCNISENLRYQTMPGMWQPSEFLFLYKGIQGGEENGKIAVCKLQTEKRSLNQFSSWKLPSKQQMRIDYQNNK